MKIYVLTVKSPAIGKFIFSGGNKYDFAINSIKLVTRLSKKI